MAIANTGKQALELFESFGPDLILLDIMLPELDGWQVCREIREDLPMPDYYADGKGRGFRQGSRFGTGGRTTMWSSRLRPRRLWRGSRPCCAVSAKPGDKLVKEVKYDKLSINLTNYELKVNGVQIDTPPKEMELIHLAKEPEPRVYPRPVA